MAHTSDGEEFHLAPLQRIRVGYVLCHRGEPLCGTPWRVRLPGLLFPPEVTCWLCELLAARDGITVTTPESALSALRAS